MGERRTLTRAFPAQVQGYVPQEGASTNIGPLVVIARGRRGREGVGGGAKRREVSDLLEERGGQTRRDAGKDGEAGRMLFCQCFPCGDSAAC